MVGSDVERRGERGLREGDCERERPSFWTSFSKRAVSERKLATSAADAVGGGRVGMGVVTAFMLGGAATSMTLSAISANASNVVPSGVEASTIRTLLGNLPRKSVRR